MQQIPNDMRDTIIRCARIVISSIPTELIAIKPRLANAVRLLTKEINKLEKMKNYERIYFSQGMV